MSYISLAKRFTALSLSACLLFVSGCKKNRHKVDISNIEIDMDLQRFESDIFHVENFEEYLALDNKHPEFFNIYKNQIIGDITGARLGADSMAQYLGFREFIQNKDMRDLYNASVETFRDMDPYFKDLKKGFTYYHYHFPDKTIPDIITYVAPFRYGSISLENDLCIELDMFLGSDFPPYQTPSLQFPAYMVKKLKPDLMVPNSMKSWLFSEFERDQSDRRFITEILYEGRILYLMDAMFPEMHDSLKMGYVMGQIEWNEENEAQIWSNIIENDLLFSTDQMQYMGLIHDGPFSKGNNVPQESSPRIGIWAGWQVVRSYMDKHPETTLQQLMEIDDPGVLLKGSGYKP